MLDKYAKQNKLNQSKCLLDKQKDNKANKQTKTNEKSSILVSILNTIKLVIGAGLLTLPWSFRYGSLWPSIIISIFTSVYSLISAVFIINVCEITQIFEYSSLLQFIGPFWEYIGAISICYVCFSTCLGYNILIGQFIVSALNDIGINSYKYDRQIYIILFVLFVLYPLSLLKNLSQLKYSSLCGFCAILYCIILLLYEAIHVNDNHDDNIIFIYNNWSFDIFIVLNVCFKAYVCHYSLPPIYQSLENRNIYKMCLILIISYIIITIIYIIFGVSGYYLFGNKTDSNILENFSKSSIKISIARISMAISLCGCFPLVFKAGIKSIETQFFNKNKHKIWNFSNKPQLRFIIISIIIFCITIVSLFIPDIGPVSSIEGAITVLFLICLFPILIIWKIGFYGHDNTNLVNLYQYQRSVESIDINTPSVSASVFTSVDDSHNNNHRNYYQNIKHKSGSSAYHEFDDENDIEIDDEKSEQIGIVSMGESIDNDNNDDDKLGKIEMSPQHIRQNTVIIKKSDTGISRDESIIAIRSIFIRNSKDICNSIFFSLMLFTGILLGIGGIIMSLTTLNE